MHVHPQLLSQIGEGAELLCAGDSIATQHLHTALVQTGGVEDFGDYHVHDDGNGNQPKKTKGAVVVKFHKDNAAELNHPYKTYRSQKSPPSPWSPPNRPIEDASNTNYGIDDQNHASQSISFGQLLVFVISAASFPVLNRGEIQVEATPPHLDRMNPEATLILGTCGCVM